MAVSGSCPYVILHGDVWYVDDTASPGGAKLGLNRHHVCTASEMLAIAFEEEDGGIHKHGDAASVTTWVDRYRATLSQADLDDPIAPPTVVSFPVTQATVDLLNMVAGNSTAGFGLLARLEALSDAEAVPAPAIPAQATTASATVQPVRLKPRGGQNNPFSPRRA